MSQQSGESYHECNEFILTWDLMKKKLVCGKQFKKVKNTLKHFQTDHQLIPRGMRNGFSSKYGWLACWSDISVPPHHTRQWRTLAACWCCFFIAITLQHPQKPPHRGPALGCQGWPTCYWYIFAHSLARNLNKSIMPCKIWRICV